MIWLWWVLIGFTALVVIAALVEIYLKRGRHVPLAERQPKPRRTPAEIEPVLRIDTADAPLRR